MKNACNKFHNINGQIVELHLLKTQNSNLSVYDVFRVDSGCPIFLDLHLERLSQSAQYINQTLWLSKATLEREILELISINQKKDGNIKVIIDFGSKEYYISYIKHHYPSKGEYKQGIKTKTYNKYRQHAKAKTINTKFKQDVSLFIDKNKISEAILIDEKKNICEGSKSNIFFVKGNKVFTPKSEKILMGISRKNIINICKHNNIEIIERSININELLYFDSAFISGTSPLILAINQIDKIKYKTDKPLFMLLILEYKRLMEVEIKKYNTKN